MNIRCNYVKLNDYWELVEYHGFNTLLRTPDWASELTSLGVGGYYKLHQLAIL